MAFSSDAERKAAFANMQNPRAGVSLKKKWSVRSSVGPTINQEPHIKSNPNLRYLVVDKANKGVVATLTAEQRDSVHYTDDYELRRAVLDIAGQPMQKGDVVMPLEDIPFLMGQISSDKLRKGERLTVDDVDEKGDIFFEGVADRYLNWSGVDFIKARSVDQTEDIYRVVFVNPGKKKKILTQHRTREEAEAASKKLSDNDYANGDWDAEFQVEERNGKKWSIVR